MSDNAFTDVVLTIPEEASTEVVVRAQRRRFSVEYKLRILQEAAQCAPGELGALLRREGLYTSNLSKWRGQRRDGQLAGLASKKRGRKLDAQAREVARLRRKKSCSCCSTKRSPRRPNRSDRAGGGLG